MLMRYAAFCSGCAFLLFNLKFWLQFLEVCQLLFVVKSISD